MIEEAIVHVGMHKTGSSSIQQTLSSVNMDDVEYLSLGSPNHSGLLATVLSNNPQKYHNHLRNGRSIKQVHELKRSFTERLHFALKMSTKKRVLLSAEDLSRPAKHNEELEYLKEILMQYCKRIRIIGYVRPPIGYMQSAFQQRLKGGSQMRFDLEKVYPYYRKRFSKMDMIFGKENVELIRYGSDSLYNGDAVQDFAKRIGVKVLADEIVRTNESLSLEATALLFTFRLYSMQPLGYEGVNRDNNYLVEALSSIGSTKLVFSQDAVAPVLSSQQDDIDWISERLNCSILDQPVESYQCINNEKDLFSMAYDNRFALASLLENTMALERELTGIAQLVDWLNALHAKTTPPLSVPTNALFNDTQLKEIISSKGNASALLKILTEALGNIGERQAAQSVRNAEKKASRMLNKSVEQ